MGELILVAGLVLLALVLAAFKSKNELKKQSGTNENKAVSAYEIAMDEIKNNAVKEGLWSMAFAHTEDEESRKKYYVRERARQITDQVQPSKKGIQWQWVTISIFVCLLAVPTALIQMGYIDNPLIRKAVGQGLIGGGAALFVLIPIYVIKKMWNWIRKS